MAGLLQETARHLLDIIAQDPLELNNLIEAELGRAAKSQQLFGGMDLYLIEVAPPIEGKLATRQEQALISHL